MTLEDFFTLAEMKNGLTASARVEELVSIMQKESSSVAKNASEAARQWCAVASVLAATVNRDSLNQFVKLDGLQFLSHWLEEAQNCSDSTSDSSMEESIMALLGVLEKLSIDWECSFSSGILKNVKDLLVHKSTKVQDKARALFDSWNQGKDTDIDNSKVDENYVMSDKEVSASAEVVQERGTREQTAGEDSLFSEEGNGDDHFLDSSECEEKVQDAKAADNHNICHTSVLGDKVDVFQNHQESLSTEDESSKQFAERTASLDALGVPAAKEADPSPLRKVSVKGPVVPDVGLDKTESSQVKSSDTNIDVVASKSQLEVVGPKEPNNSESMAMHKATNEAGKYNSNGSQGLSHDWATMRKSDNSESSHRNECSDVVKDASGLIVKLVVAKDSSQIDQSDNKLNYGVGNSREVSQELSNKLEQKGSERREPFSNPLEKSCCKIEQAFHACFANVEMIYETKSKDSLSGEAIPKKGEDPSPSSNNVDTEFEDRIQDSVSSLATESAQVASNSGKGILDIDLNDEICHEGMDHPKTPISVPNSSTAAPRTPDGCKTNSVEGSSNSSKQGQWLFEIDLNIADGGLDGAADTVLTDQIPASSCLLSGESSIEVNSQRVGIRNLDLDLNRLGENEDVPSSKMREKSFYHHVDVQYNPSPAASSSSRQPLPVNIDLNETISSVNGTDDQLIDLGESSPLNMNSCGRLRLDNGGIWIMGKKVEVNGKDLPPSHSILLSGQSRFSSMGSSLPKQQGVASMPQLYRHNVFPMAPSTSLSAVCSQAYFPYMVESRGVPVAPQIIASPMTFPPAYSPYPLPISINSTGFNLNRVGSSVASFDLNSSSTGVEGLTTEFGAGQSRLEESMSNSQCSSSGLGVKRKEPDGGLELYPYNYKQQHVWL